MKRLGIVAIGIAVLVVIIMLVTGDAERVRQKNGNVIALHPNFYNEDNFRRALASSNEAGAQKKLSAIVVPHHILASRLIAEQYARVRGDDITTVIVIGPNHNDLGLDHVATTYASWQTPYTVVHNDKTLTSSFTNLINGGDSVSVFTVEHAFGAQMPFIAHYFPNARVVPIAFSSGTTREEVEHTMSWVQSVVNENTLVVFSIDFSHYLTREVATRNDVITREKIEARDVDAIFEFTSDNVDSPASLAAFIMFADESNYEITLYGTYNSDQFTQRNDAETTSYFLMATQSE